MPTIVNSFRQPNPFADTIRSIGQSFFGPKAVAAGPSQKELLDAQGRTDLAKLIADHGTVRQFAEAGALGGMDFSQLAALPMLLAGNELGPRAPETTNAYAGSGKYKDSAQAFDMSEANDISMNDADNRTQRYGYDTQAKTSIANNTADNANDWNKFNATPEPAMAAGQPAFVPRGQLTQPGNQPILTDAQRDPIADFKSYLQIGEAAGLGPKEAQAYALQQMSKAKGMSVRTGPDGTTIEMGGPSDLTTANATKAQAQAYDFDTANATADVYRKLLMSDPGNVGAVGNIRGYAQEATQVADNLKSLFGGQAVDQGIAALRDEALNTGADPGIVADLLTYRPEIPQIETVYNVLLYQMAGALAGQSGRSVTDADVKRAQGIIGNPNEWVTSQPKMLSKLDAALGLMDSFEKLNKQRLGQPYTPRQRGAVPPAQPAPAPAPTTIINPNTGQRMQLQDGQWVPVQ